jgi:ribosomal protein S18 acetylase RimI-like enzyme
MYHLCTPHGTYYKRRNTPPAFMRRSFLPVWKKFRVFLAVFLAGHSFVTQGFAEQGIGVNGPFSSKEAMQPFCHQAFELPLITAGFTPEISVRERVRGVHAMDLHPLPDTEAREASFLYEPDPVRNLRTRRQPVTEKKASLKEHHLPKGFHLERLDLHHPLSKRMYSRLAELDFQIRKTHNKSAVKDLAKSAETFSRWLQAPTQFRVWVAQDGRKRVLAYLESYYDGNSHVEIEHIMVDEYFSRRNIGTALIRTAIRSWTALSRQRLLTLQILTIHEGLIKILVEKLPSHLRFNLAASIAGFKQYSLHLSTATPARRRATLRTASYARRLSSLGVSIGGSLLTASLVGSFVSGDSSYTAANILVMPSFGLSLSIRILLMAVFGTAAWLHSDISSRLRSTTWVLSAV